MSTAPILDRKAAELRLINARETGTIYRGSESQEGAEAPNGELLERTVEAVVQVAGELARITAQNNQTASASHDLSEAASSLKQVQVSLHESVQTLQARNDTLTNSIERLGRFVQTVEMRNNDLHADVQSQFRRMTTLTLWNVFLSAAAIAGLGVSLFFFLTRS